jgi:hypothetical protein
MPARPTLSPPARRPTRAGSAGATQDELDVLALDSLDPEASLLPEDESEELAELLDELDDDPRLSVL